MNYKLPVSERSATANRVAKHLPALREGPREQATLDWIEQIFDLDGWQ
jgi:hypothetical protein